MTVGVFKNRIKELHESYKSYDIFATAPQTRLGFSIFNGLIFALFMFDWFRAVIHRFKLHQKTHVVFKVVSRKLGHPHLPKDTWFSAAPRDSYSYGGAGACLRPKKSGMSYFLYLCYSHSNFGLGSYVLFQLAYVLFVGFPFYNWIPIVNHFMQTKGGEIFSDARMILWGVHSILAILLINKYFAGVEGQPLSKFHWVMALTIPLWLVPIFPIMLFYGRFCYKGYRAPPPPPSYRFSSATNVDEDQKEEEEGESDSE